MSDIQKLSNLKKAVIDYVMYVIVIIAFFSTSDILNSKLFNVCGSVMQVCFDTLLARPWLLVSLVLTILLLTTIFVINHWKDCYRSRTVIMLFVLAVILLIVSTEHWTYLPVVGWFTMLHLFLLCISVCLLSIFVKPRKHGNNNHSGKKFTIDNHKDDLQVDANRKEYADALVERVLGTDLKEEAYSVGIAGEWGTGKTTFLKAIESSFKTLNPARVASIVWFKPWNSSKTGQIITDFFNTLIDSIGPNYSAIKKPLLKYAELLNAVYAKKSLVYMIGLFDSHREKSLSAIKQSISQYLVDYKKIIPVLIDDMDRLTSQEIADILKLIRNTADFPNVVYIAAYDKNYVVQQLASRHVSDPSRYLEKFFSVEFVLPKMDDNYQYSVFASEAKQMASDPQIINYLERMPGRTRWILCKSFDNFRQVKRFARIFVHDAEFFATKHNINQIISIDDLLLLKVLYLKDPALYFIMEREPDRIMFRSKDDWRGIYPFKLKQRIFNKDDKEVPGIKTYNGEPIDGISKDILEALFTLSNKKDAKNLLNSESYPLYFALNVPSSHISVDEVRKFLAGNEDLWVQYEKWSKEGRLNSLFFHLMCFEPDKMGEHSVKRYVSLVVKLLPDLNTHDGIIKRALMCRAYHESQIEMVKKHAKSVFERVINSIGIEDVFYSFEKMARALVNIYEREDYSERQTGDSGCTLLGSSSNAQRLLVHNFQRFVSLTQPNTDELFRDDSVLQGVVKASVLTDYYQEDDITYHWNLITDALLEYFSNHKGHDKEYASNKYNVPADTPPEIEDEVAEQKQEEKERIFGDADLYKKILENCFE